jgi:tetratricopeptide (TPR) repeat protein
VRLAWLIATVLIVSGCATVPAGTGTSSQAEPREAEQLGPDGQAPGNGGQATESPSPRSVASLQLVRAAKSLIDDGRPDEAIRMLERAVNINPGNGQAYYYLAEAWLMKDDPDQADEYNRLAARHLGSAPPWPERIRSQAEQIHQWLR